MKTIARIWVTSYVWIGKVADVTTELITLKDNELEPITVLSELNHSKIGVKRDDAIAAFLADKGLNLIKN